MARTQILPTDPGAVKVWAAKVALDSAKKRYFSKMIGSEGSYMPVVEKTDLEAKPGDEVTTTLIAKLRGKPVEGQEKLAGRAMKLTSATHKMRIDKHRQAVNVGDVMDQKRVNWSIPEQARDRLSDYMGEVYDEQITMTAAGARGIGDEIQHYPIAYAGFPNAFIAPDAQHLMTFDGSRANAAALTSGDKLGTNVLDKLVLRAKKQIGDVAGGKPVRMEPIRTDGGKHFVYLSCPESMYDLRREVGDAGWLTLEKAKMTQEGKNSVVFKGGAAYYNGVLIDETQTCVKFDTTTAGGSYGTSLVARNLFLGANAVAVAHGTKSQRDGMKYELTEDDEDYGEEGIIIVRMIAGFSKCRFSPDGVPANGLDFGLIANDVAYTAAT
jgi:N4-gp56 family major capsid protein